MKEFENCLLVQIDNEGPGMVTGLMIKTERVSVDYQSELEFRVTVLKGDNTQEVFINPRYIGVISDKDVYKHFIYNLQISKAHKEIDRLVQYIVDTTINIDSKYSVGNDYIINYLKKAIFN